MGDTRKKKVPGIMRDILALNVKALMAIEFEHEPDQFAALAKKTGLSKSSIQRTVESETGASIDTIEALALALNVSPYQLILPNLDPANPQIVADATAAEKRLYARMAALARAKR